ncbi:MAG TPA: OsmC family protein [Gemmatimonadales bacterium]
MSEYSAAVTWERKDAVFVDGRYSRAHTWQFDGGAVVRASSSPHSVPLPYSDATAVDPEEAFVAALASCHMLWFLAIAAKQGYRVESYRDDAQGTLARGPNGKPCMTTVTLRPHVTFSGTKVPAAEVVRAMHEQAHAECYIANSVTTHMTTVPTYETIVTDPR